MENKYEMLKDTIYQLYSKEGRTKSYISRLLNLNRKTLIQYINDIWKLPKGLMNGFAKLGDILHLPLNSERLRKLTENYISSNEKIKKALGVERMPVDARTGLQTTLRSFNQ